MDDLYYKTRIYSSWVFIMQFVNLIYIIACLCAYNTTRKRYTKKVMIGKLTLQVMPMVDTICDMITGYKLDLGLGEVVTLCVISGIIATAGLPFVIFWRFQYVKYAKRINQGIYGEDIEIVHDMPISKRHLGWKTSFFYWAKPFQRKNIHKLLNHSGAVNLVFGIWTHNCIIFIMNVCRATTIESDNVSRVWDVSFASILGICFFLALIILDFFMFRSCTHHAIFHLVTVAMFAISLQAEINGLLGYDEAITFVFVVITVPVILLKIIISAYYRDEVYRDVVSELRAQLRSANNGRSVEEHAHKD